MKDSPNETPVELIESKINPNVHELLGIWKNTNPQTKNIVKAIIAFDGKQLTMQVFSADRPQLKDWGKAKLQVFTPDRDSPVAGGFITQYNRDSVKTTIAANYKRGVLVLQAYNTHKDSRDKFNDFSREFFHK